LNERQPAANRRLAEENDGGLEVDMDDELHLDAVVEGVYDVVQG
jgi:hypothetical protein